MKAILRSAVLAAGVASTIALSTTGASATAVGVFEGTATVNCFGCGTSTGTATLCVHGEVAGHPVNPPPGCPDGYATASYTVFEADSETDCLISGTANGTVTGVPGSTGTVSFDWDRYGAVAVISTTGGGYTGNGAAVFVVNTAGNPCRTKVTATVAGALVSP